jgi:transcriptional regulator GlxA family with amidase domain
MRPYQYELTLVVSFLYQSLDLSSRGHFTRSFRITTGMMHKWLLLRRIQPAKSLLLESSIATAKIAVICGFADQSLCLS